VSKYIPQVKTHAFAAPSTLKDYGPPAADRDSQQGALQGESLFTLTA